MSPFPRPDYAGLERYDPARAPVRADLSDNTNLWGTHPAALERIRAAGTDDLARYPELYADTLREAVAERFGVDVDCVTTGAGSDDVLDSAYRAVYAPGASMRYPAPTFSMVEPLALMNGMAAHGVLWPEALDDPSTLLEGEPDLVYVCRPNNPTGQQAPLEWLEELLELRGSDGPLVIVDEAYADFAGESLVSRAPELPRVLVTRTLSKAYGLAGLRCGFAVGRPDVVLEVEKSRGPYKVARLTAEAAAAAVRDEEGWMAGIVEASVENRLRLHDELARRGLEPLSSRANFLFFPAPTGRAGHDALSLRDAGVGVRPFSGVPGMEEGLRVTVGPWELMDDFLASLDTAFPELKP
ncbi:MAG: aminotransferase class I/II-fold pyridoxal phosphate-dependent enzyme [Longimicrobiales bacterium]|nr:aminotransferase class I/II-fold pyridoxal phosphate-dependent enzyme [Longimicrobiales bacterium]